MDPTVGPHNDQLHVVNSEVPQDRQGEDGKKLCHASGSNDTQKASEDYLQERDRVVFSALGVLRALHDTICGESSS